MTALQNNPLGEGKTGKYLLTPFYPLPFIVEFCLLSMLTFSPFQLCYTAFSSSPEEARASVDPIWQVFRCDDLSLSVGAVHGNFLVRGGGSGYSSGDVKLWIRCDPLLGLEHKGDNHGGGVGRAEKGWCINWFLLSQLVYLSGHLNTYQRSTDKQFQY